MNNREDPLRTNSDARVYASPHSLSPSAGSESVQEPLHCQQRVHSGAGAQRRGLAQVQDQHRQHQVDTGEERGAVEHQVLPC